MRASSPVTPVGLGPFLALDIYLGSGVYLAMQSPAHEDVCFGSKKRPFGEGRPASAARDWLGRGQLKPGAGTQVRLVSCQDDSGHGGGSVAKATFKTSQKMCSLSLSARLIPAPASAWGEVGPDTEGEKGRHHVGDGELCLSPPLPSSVSLGHLTLHPRAPELLLFPLPPRATPGTRHEPISQTGSQGPGWGHG